MPVNFDAFVNNSGKIYSVKKRVSLDQIESMNSESACMRSI